MLPPSALVHTHQTFLKMLVVIALICTLKVLFFTVHIEILDVDVWREKKSVGVKLI